jgi:hypothetical protein
MDDGVALILLALATGGAVIFFALRQNLRQEQVLQAQERALEAEAAGAYLNDLLNSGTRIRLNFGEAPSIELKQSEEILCVFPETTLIEPRAVSSWVSNFGASAIRIARGLSLRLERSADTIESHDELRALDTGTLVITTQRLIYVCSKHTISSLPLEKISDIDTGGYRDALRINRENRQTVEFFKFNTSLTIPFQHNGEQHSVPLLSAIVQAAIEQAVKYRYHTEAVARKAA